MFKMLVHFQESLTTITSSSEFLIVVHDLQPLSNKWKGSHVLVLLNTIWPFCCIYMDPIIVFSINNDTIKTHGLITRLRFSLSCQLCCWWCCCCCCCWCCCCCCCCCVVVVLVLLLLLFCRSYWSTHISYLEKGLTDKGIRTCHT